MARGVEEGIARGVEEGIARGVEEGVARGVAHAVLAVLAARGVVMSDAEHTRILDERDLDQLKRWLVRAATCANAHELWARTGEV